MNVRFMKKNKIQQFKNNCVFCKKNNVTYEHLFPQWLGAKVKITDNYTPITREVLKRDSNPYAQRQDLSKITGRPVTSIQIKRFCGTCNGGWMSQIEEKMKLIYEKLNKSLYYVNLSKNEIETLSAWATLKTIVWSLTCAETLAIPDSDIAYFYEHKTPPPGWKIWLGHYTSGKNLTPISIFQRPGLLAIGSTPFPSYENRDYNCQSTSFCIDKVFIHTISHTPELDQLFSTSYQTLDMVKKVWPAPEIFRTKFKCLPAMDSIQVEILTHTYGMVLDRELLHFDKTPPKSFEQQIAEIKSRKLNPVTQSKPI